MELLSAGLEQMKPTQPCPQKFTTSPPAPPPAKVPVLGLDSSPATEKITKATESTDEPAPKHHHITLVPVTSSVPPSSSSVHVLMQPSPMASYPIVVIPEFAIPVDSYHECINLPSGEEYFCHMCSFWHCNLDCVLTHI